MIFFLSAYREFGFLGIKQAYSSWKQDRNDNWKNWRLFKILVLTPIGYLVTYLCGFFPSLFMVIPMYEFAHGFLGPQSDFMSALLWPHVEPLYNLIGNFTSWIDSVAFTWPAWKMWLTAYLLYVPLQAIRVMLLAFKFSGLYASIFSVMMILNLIFNITVRIQDESNGKKYDIDGNQIISKSEKDQSNGYGGKLQNFSSDDQPQIKYVVNNTDLSEKNCKTYGDRWTVAWRNMSQGHCEPEVWFHDMRKQTDITRFRDQEVREWARKYDLTKDGERYE
jgi:hypothetical protein